MNSSWQAAPWADALYACDWQWWERYHGIDFAGERWTCNDKAAKRFGVNWVAYQHARGLNRQPGVINSGLNSGFQAINLAWHFGARRIVLLGYDFQRTAGRSHWHGDHPAGFANGGNYREWAHHMADLARDLAADDVEVINASRQTALACFPRRPLEGIL